MEKVSLSAWDWLKRLQTYFSAPGQVYLVGGAVRDLLLQRPCHDLDFVTTGDALALGRRVANHLGGAFYVLDGERGTARVILGEAAEQLYFDFAALRAPTLEEDLRLRDFCINAIAMDAATLDQTVDPCGGAADLKDQVLRMCSPGSMQDDPLRILRGVRLSLRFHLRIEEETLRAMKAAVDQLNRVSNERLRDELFNLLEGPHVASAIQLMDRLGALPYVLPELPALKGVSQSPPHIWDVWAHTLDTLRQLEILLHLLAEPYEEERGADLINGLAVMRLGRFRGPLQEHFQTSLHPMRSRRALLMLAALYHDAGKPSRRSVEEGGRVRFFQHELESKRLAAKCGHALALSNTEIDALSTLAHQHMRLHHLANQEASLTRRMIYRYFRACGSLGIEVIFLSLADLRATYGATLPQELWLKELDLARELLTTYWEHSEVVKPPRLLGGAELIAALQLTPGPEVGRLLHELEEAQAAGEVNDAAAALEFVRQLHEKGEVVGN